MHKIPIEKIIKSKIREIDNWPKRGVNFKDITPLLQDAATFQMVINEMAKPYFLTKKVDKVVGIDARGFIIASALAYKLKAGLAIVRKKGKLPLTSLTRRDAGGRRERSSLRLKIISRKYSLEYSANTLEMHTDSILPGERILLVDDVLATGGTMLAVKELVDELQGKIIGIDFLIELSSLEGRKKLKGQKVRALVRY